MRLTWILAALALGLALLAVALRGHGPRPEAVARVARVAPAPAAGPGPELHDPEVAELAPAGAAQLRTAAAESSGARTAAQPAPQERVERLIVRGRVRAQARDLDRATLELSRESGHRRIAVRGTCAPDGSYEIDASELLDDALRGRSNCGLELAVAHPDCLPKVASIAIVDGDGVDVPQGWSRFRWRGGTTVCELEVTLLPGALVRGTLIGVDDPRRCAIGAALGLDGRPDAGWIERTTPDEHGDFELRLPPGASYAIVAAAPGLRPAVAWVDLLGTGARAVTLAPERGAEISGVLRIAPQFPSRNVGLDLQLPREPRAAQPVAWPRLAPGHDALVWIDGAFEWRVRSARTDTAGRFAFSGLAPLEYELRALGVGVPGETLRAWPVARLRAPAEGVTLGPVLASLDLDLGARGPLSFRMVEEPGSALHLGPYSTDALGLAQVHLPPGRDWRVLVGDDSYGFVSTPAAGELARFALARER